MMSRWFKRSGILAFDKLLVAPANDLGFYWLTNEGGAGEVPQEIKSAVQNALKTATEGR